MGSTLSYYDCPKCGGKETYQSDFYYKTDEEYCFCIRCGYTFNSFLRHHYELKDGKERRCLYREYTQYPVKDVCVATKTETEDNKPYAYITDSMCGKDIQDMLGYDNKTKDWYHLAAKDADGEFERISYMYASVVKEAGSDTLLVGNTVWNEEEHGGYGVIIVSSEGGFAQVIPMEKDYHKNEVILEGTMGKDETLVSFTLESPEIVYATAMIDGNIKTLKADAEHMDIRKLTGADYEQAKAMDDISGFAVSDWLEPLDGELEETADNCYGIFLDDEMLGYATIGGADVLNNEKAVVNYPGYSCDSYLLSDVFVKEDQRNKGIATALINRIIWENGDNPIFLTYIEDSLETFYKKKFGFKKVEGTEGIMAIPSKWESYKIPVDDKEYELTGDDLPF